MGEAAIPKEQKRKLPTWEDELRPDKMIFRNPELDYFRGKMLAFLQTDGKLMREQLDAALRLTYREYQDQPEVIPELVRSVAMGCVLTQYKVDDTGAEITESPKRKTETVVDPDSVTAENPEGIPVFKPAFTHPLAVYIDCLESGKSIRMAIAAPMHDAAEDAQIKFGEKIVAKTGILDIIKTEFTDGQNIAALIEAVSKYDTIPGEVENTIKSHFLYISLLTHVQDYISRHDEEPITQDELEKITMKAISSLIKIPFSLMKYVNDMDETSNTVKEHLFSKLLAEAMNLKCSDTNHNLESPGTNAALRFRARILATFGRLMHSPYADKILANLGRQYTDDPLFDNSDLNKVAAMLDEDSAVHAYSEESNHCLRDGFEIIISDRIEVGYRISFHDETLDTFSTRVPQVIMYCSKDEIRQIKTILEESEEINVHDYSLTPFDGVIENVLNVLGRSGVMIAVKKDGVLHHYIRVVSDEPKYADAAQRNFEAAKQAPESNIFTPMLQNGTGVESKVKALLDTFAVLTFNPESLRLDQNTVMYVSPNGVYSCDKSTPKEVICRHLNININEFDPRQIMTGLPANLENPEELHIYMLGKDPDEVISGFGR